VTGRATRSLGLAVTVVVNLALAALNLYQRRQIEQQQRQGGCASMTLLVAGLQQEGTCMSWPELCLSGLRAPMCMRAAVGRGSCVGVAAHASVHAHLIRWSQCWACLDGWCALSSCRGRQGHCEHLLL